MTHSASGTGWGCEDAPVPTSLSIRHRDRTPDTERAGDVPRWVPAPFQRVLEPLQESFRCPSSLVGVLGVAIVELKVLLMLMHLLCHY